MITEEEQEPKALGTQKEEDISNDTQIYIKRGKRKRAGVSPAFSIEIVAKDGDEIFKDVIKMKRKTPVKAYQIMRSILEDLDINKSETTKKEDIKIEIEDIPRVGNYFVDLVLSVADQEGTSFELTEENIDAYDDMIKVQLLALLLRNLIKKGKVIEKK